MWITAEAQIGRPTFPEKASFSPSNISGGKNYFGMISSAHPDF
jgi:hypothetical protein